MEALDWVWYGTCLESQQRQRQVDLCDLYKASLVYEVIPGICKDPISTNKKLKASSKPGETEALNQDRIVLSSKRMAGAELRDSFVEDCGSGGWVDRIPVPWDCPLVLP